MAINILPPETAAKIAAGEVVERPASVAKELIENSLDAGASRIDVEIMAGGVGLLRVVDNGAGMSAEDAPIAFMRYATSKLATAEDLERIATHGFRGEALPSIAAVAEVTVLTRQHDQLGGTFVRATGGKVAEAAPRGAPPGTSVTVKGLFQNIPARLKFLRSNNAEASRIAALVSQFSLAYPEVRFRLNVDGRTVVQSEGDGDLRQAAIGVYGLEAAEGMLPVMWEDEGAGLLVRVDGLVSPPAVSRSNRSYISLFVNRRLVQDRTLTYAVVDAYQGLLMVGRYPIAILNLSIDPSEIDVNVHPTKMEIKFRDEGLAFSALRKGVSEALTRSGVSRPASGGFAAAPAFGAPPAGGNAVPSPAGGTLGRVALTPVPATLSAPSSQVGDDSVFPAAPAPQAGPAMPAEPAPVQGELPVPILRPLGQVGRTYIVAEGPDGMYLIDQHAAHERVLFDRFRRDRTRGAVQAQGLLEPAAVELTHQQQELLSAHGEALEAYGFSIEPFGEHSVLLRAVPAGLMPKGPSAALRDLLDTLEGDGLQGYTWDDRILTVLACHSAVRAGHDLALPEMEQIVRLLESTDNPRTCPHGRPTMLHMSSFQLEKEFGRR